jgi:hypothetical protein
MSWASERATSQKGLPVTGLMFSKYFPFAGATHLPPMKFSYRFLKVILLPGVPGSA